MAGAIEQIDRAAARRISEATEAALQSVASDLGLEVKVGGGRFDPQVGTFSPKVEFALGDSERRAFEHDAPLFGVEPGAYGTEFEAKGRIMRLVGFNLRSPKYCVLVEVVETGERRKMTDHVLDREGLRGAMPSEAALEAGS